MKKLFILALAGTMALAAASCQKDPSFDDSASGTKEVITQFVLNVTAAPQTKMTADAVQQNHNFRGIQDGKIFTYKTGVNLETTTPYVLTSATAADKTFEFPFFFAASAIDNTTDNNQTDVNGDASVASKRILQLSVPIGTDAVLFYGKAIKSSGAKDSEFGASESGTVISSTPNETVIKAKKILNDENRTAYDHTGALMIYLINDILGTDVIEADTPGTIGSYKYTSLPAISWAQIGHQYEINNYSSTSRYQASQGVTNADRDQSKLEPLEEVLGKCYYLFTYLTPSDVPSDITFGTEAWKQWVKDHPDLRHHEEYRSGSSRAIKTMIIDMYKIIKAAKDADPTNDYEANARRLADQILIRAQRYFDMENGSYLDITTLQSLINEKNGNNSTYWNNHFDGAQNLNNFPYEDFGIPEGAAQLGFKAQTADLTSQPKDEFYYKIPNQPLVNPMMTDFEPKKYLYPAELWYYVNSPLRTSTDGNITATNYPDGVNNWKNDAKWTGWASPGRVASATRAVAVTNSINYGVALLQSNVSYSVGTLYDNRSAMTEETTNKTILAADAKLQLRGILVGGVNPRMNWQFIRKYDAAGNYEGVDNNNLSLFDGVIYDHFFGKNDQNQESPVEIPSSTSSSASFHTLVYDNYNSSETQENQNDVFVALEFVNGGDPFWGRDNLIPSGGVFYLLAKLHKPTASDISGLESAWPADHQIPPVYGVNGETVPSGKKAGESKKIARVFIQDFVTTANFKIGANSLQHAYYSVPDLRASQMSLGLSVDLQWIPGITYNDLVL